MGLRILWGFHFKTKTFAAGCRSWNCKFSANCIKKLKILFIGCLRMTETSGWNLTPHLLPGQNTLGQHYNLINLAISVVNEQPAVCLFLSLVTLVPRKTGCGYIHHGLVTLIWTISHLLTSSQYVFLLQKVTPEPCLLIYEIKFQGLKNAIQLIAKPLWTPNMWEIKEIKESVWGVDEYLESKYVQVMIVNSLLILQ